MINKGKIVK